MRTHACHVLLPILASLLAFGCAAPADEEATGSAASDIIGGTEAPFDRAVAVVATGADAQSLTGRCTATLIAPRVLLTAGHCVHGRGEPSPKVFAFFFGPDENRADASFTLAARAVAHPDYVAGAETGADVAVLLLDEPVKGIRPIPLNRRPLGKSLVGDAVRAVGYGSDDGTTTTTGVRATVTVRVTKVEPRELTIGRVGRTTCHGDSGGPVLSTDLRPVLLGVTSRGDRADCAGISISTRVDAVLDFLEPFLADQGRQLQRRSQESAPVPVRSHTS